MPSVVHFGAGKVGRGFLGHLYARAGWDIVFLDVMPDVVRALDERGSYPIEIGTPSIEVILG